MAKQQIHKRFTCDQVVTILKKYVTRELKAKDVMDYLEISRTRLYQIANEYQMNPENFSLSCGRKASNNRLNPTIEKNILKELEIEKTKIVDNPNVPTRRYNYSYIRDLLLDKYEQNVSVPTIIDRAKKHGYWKGKPPKKIHDREVITNYTGELVQHDASHHLWAPDAKEKWALITSLDDYSRTLLYADFWKTETTWAHVYAAQSLILKHGAPLSYYVDQLSVFRYVKDRDKHSPWVKYKKFTDDVDPQWKQVMKDCSVKVIYALSAQAKGKVERPYQWLQDRVARTCVREGVDNIVEARTVLKDEVDAYNKKRVHSTTGEVPYWRMSKAIKEDKTLFRPFEIKEPFVSAKDIFCLRIKRIVDSYRKVSLKNFTMKVPGVMPRQEVELRMYPNQKTGIVDVRFWHAGAFKGSQRVKISDLPIVQF